MKVVVTGAAGFLGYHARAWLACDPQASVTPVTRDGYTPQALQRAVADADVIVHAAGINRGADDDLEAGNIALADRLVAALEATGARPAIAYAGSNYADEHHPGYDTPYGRGKREAGARLIAWAQRAGATAADLRLPGLFGEHGRPDYNSFVATFAHRIARGEQPRVTGDRELPLVHVHDAVRRLLAAADVGAHGVLEQPGEPMLISRVAQRLTYFHDTYAATGDIPDLTGPLDVPLFNTLRAAMWPHAYPIAAVPRSDPRGTLVESVRVHGGGGQVFVSTTNPGFTRGEHVHFGKIERFLVLGGTGLIRLRRLVTDELIEFRVTGEEPAVIDMPTLWTHSITNVGDGPLTTLFWTNELFDPQRPDTYPMHVLDGPDRP